MTAVAGPDLEWRELSRRAALQSHRLIGWIYWDPRAIANYAALGVPDGIGYYIATRGATLGAAGNDVVTAAFYSIHPGFVAFGLDQCRAHTTFEDAAAARDAAVVAGLREYVPEICDELASMAPQLWSAADALPLAGRALFASTRAWPRPDDALLSAWLAVNCIREWRGDTHWAIQIAEDISGTAAGILDGAWRNYDGDWLARSRGADDAALDVLLPAHGVQQLVRDGLVDERAPAIGHDGFRRGGELVLGVLYGAEAGSERLGQAVGDLFPVRAHRMPEQGVQDVAAAVERQIAAERPDCGEVVLLPSGLQLLHRRVQPVHVPGVVLAMVDRLRLGIKPRLQRVGGPHLRGVGGVAACRQQLVAGIEHAVGFDLECHAGQGNLR